MAEHSHPVTRPGHPRPQALAGTALAALGIVYGDIGTSPLYAFKQAADAGGALSPESITGTVSLILWALILIVSLKYAILIMRADNYGERGRDGHAGGARCPPCRLRKLARLAPHHRARRSRAALWRWR